MDPRFGIRFCNVEKWFPDLEFDFATLKNGFPIWDELFQLVWLIPNWGIVIFTKQTFAQMRKGYFKEDGSHLRRSIIFITMPMFGSRIII